MEVNHKTMTVTVKQLRFICADDEADFANPNDKVWETFMAMYEICNGTYFSGWAVKSWDFCVSEMEKERWSMALELKELIDKTRNDAENQGWNYYEVLEEEAEFDVNEFIQDNPEWRFGVELALWASVEKERENAE